MPDITGSIITQSQRRTFFVKSVILVVGSLLILTGSVIRSSSPYLGYSMWVLGVGIDWYIIYIVYREMNGIRTDIENTRDNIQETEEEILETQMKVENTAQRIEGIATDMYDRQGSTDRFGNLERNYENLAENISNDESDPYQY
ncbi:hypothetical protein [Natrinema versiforme]|uniref:Uncharacterized protein n=1 Tax=Natrinema versiforme TaxID=88724 RepID=A0A4V1FZQ2_9EURY|nr:hypothetical protein [Natrinema versiforme]QCS42636.1 hypothetical protein FEJ81_09790 [Natrinema versiforme]